jgi:hypothetical protein
MTEPDKVLRAVRIILQWEGIDFLIWFLDLAWIHFNEIDLVHNIMEGIVAESRAASKHVAVVVQADISPEQVKKHDSFVQKCVSSKLPIYYSFAGSANAINLVLSYRERRLGKR